MLTKQLSKKIIKLPSGCWIWSGSECAGGYTQIYANGARKMAHRHIYELLVDKIPDGYELDHLCRIRSCVNPEHLEPVTHKENIGRGNSGINHRNKTHCKNGHKFTQDNTYITKKGFRQCRTCHRNAETIRRNT